MKKLKTLTFVLLAILLFNSCEKESEESGHSIRVKNENTSTWEDIKIGPLSFGNVSGGTTTAYKSIDAGTHKITLVHGQTTQESEVTLSGDGNKMTIIANAAGEFDLVKD
jgi:hypothetical protein